MNCNIFTQQITWTPPCCSKDKPSITRFLKLTLLNVLLFMGGISFSNSAAAQTNTGSCAGNFSVVASRDYDGGSNTTTYTFQVTRTGAQNALSHFGFPVSACPGSSF